MFTNEEGRAFLKADDWRLIETLETDQKRGLPHPNPQIDPAPGATVLDLVPPDQFTVGGVPLLEVLRRRRSRRKFTEEALGCEELSFLLWATQGVRKQFQKGVVSWRTVPSGGGRHSFETRLLALRVEGLEAGIWRYLPLDHRLCLERAVPSGLSDLATEACLGQPWAGTGAALFVWTTIPRRMEWRYGPVSHKVIAQDSGHLCQNLYLASEAVGGGACAIGAYDQKKMDALLGVDGVEEFTVYTATVGKIRG